jgi:uncharacterized RDD family membrane protein YckC
MNKTATISNSTKANTKKIVSGNLFSRTVAFIIDLVCVAFIAGILVSLFQMGFSNLPNVKNMFETYDSYYFDSGLFIEDDKGEIALIEFETYEGYQNATYSYYTDFKVNKCPKNYQDDKYDTYWYNVHILGLEDKLNKYTETELSSLPKFIAEKGHQLFEYQLDLENNPDYNVIGKAKSSASPEELLAYFFIPDDKNLDNSEYVYIIAAKDLFSTPYFMKTLDDIQLWVNYIPMFTSIIISSIVFLFVIPMISKHGKTLGKMLFHLAVVNSLGYDIKKTQLIPRFWFPVLVLIFAFFVSQLVGRYVLMSMLLFVTLFTLVSYCMVLFTKDHKGIHDYFALTMVINEKESIWFKDANEEERVTKNINAVSSKSNLEEEIEGKNILYVNSGAESTQKENDLKTDD